MPQRLKSLNWLKYIKRIDLYLNSCEQNSVNTRLAMPRLLSMKDKFQSQTDIKLHQSDIPSIQVEYSDGQKLKFNSSSISPQNIIERIQRHSIKLSEDELK